MTGGAFRSKNIEWNGGYQPRIFDLEERSGVLGVQHDHAPIQNLLVVFDEMRGAGKTVVMRPGGDKDVIVPRRPFPRRNVPGQHQQGGDAAGIVVGAVKVSVMMGRDDDVLVVTAGTMPTIFQTLHLYFAQFGDGLGLFSLVVLFSLNQVSEASGQIDILGAVGEGLSVDLNGEIIEGTKDFSVPSSGLLTLRTDGQGDLLAGSARITSDRHLEGVVLFGGNNGLAGVGSSPAFPFGFAAPMQRNEASQINSGIAVTRLSGDQDPLGQDQGSLEMTLLDVGGAVLATASDQLPPNGHKALFVTEINWDTPVDFSDFIGILRVTCSEPVTATVVQTRADELVTMPVAGLQPPQPQPAGHYGGAPAGAAQHHYYFAQFADGLGLLSSQILLLNLTAQLKLVGMGHAAIFIDEFEWSVPVDFSRFEGLMELETT
jgi:hypothetical protein